MVASSGLTAAVRHDAGVPPRCRELHRVERRRQRSNLIDLDQDGVATVVEPASKPLEFVTRCHHDQASPRCRAGGGSPNRPSVLANAVPIETDRIAAAETASSRRRGARKLRFSLEELVSPIRTLSDGRDTSSRARSRCGLITGAFDRAINSFTPPVRRSGSREHRLVADRSRVRDRGAYARSADTSPPPPECL